MASLKGTLYTAVDTALLGRGVPRRINGQVIRFPARYSRYYPSSYQPETHSFLRSHCTSGTAAIDVGAHIGLFTVVMAKLVGPEGQVFSFEPTPDSFAALREAVRLNGYEESVNLRRQAVSSHDGRLEFFMTPTSVSNANSLVGGPGAEQVEVDVVRLDSLEPRRRVSVIKVDAEGAEVQVLEGARDLISRDQPAIALDVHPSAIEQSGSSLSRLCQVIDELALEPWQAQERISAEWIRQQREIFDLQLLQTPGAD
jgi:FkbM family methyltransferase